MRWFLLLLACSAVYAQSRPCHDDARRHQFDFWLGEWDVQVKGKVVARSRIDNVLDGCLVQENWMPLHGREGKSWNYFISAKGQWEQLWMSGGNVVKLAGTLNDGAMVLEGRPDDPAKASTVNRITYTPNPDGTVRQVWTQSSDGGKTWTAVFDGLYVKKP